MKKIIISIVVVIVIAVGAARTWYHVTYEGKDYYVKIISDGKKEDIGEFMGKRDYEWEYNLLAYDQSGNEKQMKFTGDHNLRKGAYLNLTYNSHKGVTAWNEVKEEKVPKAAVEKLKS